jgi:hypothetical protein
MILTDKKKVTDKGSLRVIIENKPLRSRTLKNQVSTPHNEVGLKGRLVFFLGLGTFRAMWGMGKVYREVG